MPRHRHAANWTPEQLQEISRYSNSNYEMDFDGKVEIVLKVLERGRET